MTTRFISLILFLFSCIPFIFAQTKVIKVNAIKSNDYGVRYSLPKTNLIIMVEYSEIRKKAGPYAQYAARYLGANDADVVFEDQILYSLDKISVEERGIPNTDQTYLVSFKSKTTSPFVYLTEDGLICTINAEYEKEKTPYKESSKRSATDELQINPQSIYTEEYLRAGSISKMAEVAAKSIYKIRESRQDLLTGETDNVPKDGEAMKIILANLDAQEKLWTELFNGTSETINHIKQIIIEPTTEVNKEILFRFSKHLGVVDKDDLSGTPVYMNLTDLYTVEIPETDPKRKSKEPESIVYNVPGKADIEIFYGMKKIVSATMNVTQFGTTQILANSIFEDKKAPVKVFFYPNTGAIKQIIQ